MMKRKRSLLWIILIVFTSIGLFGFSNSPDPILQDENPNDAGWIEVTIYAEAIVYDGNIAGDMVWFPTKALLPITHEGSSMYWRVHGDNAFTALKSWGTAGGGVLTWDIFQPVMWIVNGILYPDCSVEFFLDVVEYPGIGTACAPVVGCIAEPIPAETYPGPILTVPYGETMAEISWNEIPNTTGEFVIFIESMTAGGACQEAHYLP